jgi:polysaccharide export outer membrane protein
MAALRRSHLAAAAAFALAAPLLSGCAASPGARVSFYGGPHPTASFANIRYADWSDQEPAYRLYPGDILDVSAPSAPELARTVTVQPDGRISLPLIGPVMAANRTVPEMEVALSRAYAGQLLRPQIDVAVRQAAPLKVFIGGDVKAPGVYDMPGDIDALQGVIMAGGFLPSARRQEVVVIRRGLDGRPMMRTVDLRRAVFNPGTSDAAPLRRFDIVYVPKSAIAEVDQFVDLYLRQTLPVQFSYAVGGNYVSAP